MQPYPYRDNPQVWVEHAHGGRGGLGFVLLVLLAIALAALIGYVVARMAAGRRAAHVAAPAGDEPLALLRLRYARGEIDRETFLQTSADLGGLPPPATA